MSDVKLKWYGRVLLAFAATFAIVGVMFIVSFLVAMFIDMVQVWQRLLYG